MALDIAVVALRRLIYDWDSFGDLSGAAVVISTSRCDRARVADRFALSLVLGYDDVLLPTDPGAYSAEMAGRVARFVKELERGEAIRQLYVVCDFGQSRSAGMAAAILRYLGEEEMYYWRSADYHPNTLVYSLTAEALGVPVTGEDLEYLQSVNEKAFHDALL